MRIIKKTTNLNKPWVPVKAGGIFICPFALKSCRSACNVIQFCYKMSEHRYLIEIKRREFKMVDLKTGSNALEVRDLAQLQGPVHVICVQNVHRPDERQWVNFTFAMISYQFIARTTKKENPTQRLCEWINILQLVVIVSTLSSVLVWSMTKTV